MRVERLEIRFEARTQNGILDVLVQGEQMRMALADAGPDDGGLSPGIKRSQALQRQKERGNAHLFQVSFERFLLVARNISEKTECEVQLLGLKPAQTGQARIQCRQGFFAFGGDFEADEKAIGHKLAALRVRARVATGEPDARTFAIFGLAPSKRMRD